jgi:DNA-binding response OmpR family regulator
MPRILVVEDDVDARDLIALRLLVSGHQVVTAEDSAQALAHVERIGAPDVYLLDIGLPDLDGFELLNRLRAQEGPAVPVVFLSARSTPEDLVRGLEAGANGYVTKPFRADCLATAIEVAADAAAPADPFTHGW